MYGHDKGCVSCVVYFLHRQMADVSFPTTKEALLRVVGDRNVNTDWNTSVSMKVFIEPIIKESFTCAADFYSALIASFR